MLHQLRRFGRNTGFAFHAFNMRTAVAPKVDRHRPAEFSNASDLRQLNIMIHRANIEELRSPVHLRQVFELYWCRLGWILNGLVTLAIVDQPRGCSPLAGD